MERIYKEQRQNSQTVMGKAYRITPKTTRLQLLSKGLQFKNLFHWGIEVRSSIGRFLKKLFSAAYDCGKKVKI